ncbi:MlaC/ttg2D family ABC transporter substrate-binding protein [Frigidibacter sp. MR17.24]|uniref:MlaC/ttg2D family ABC transporter substrate-binding protein n=1 Tax=Frigidibacter sp. MR17.24 TaxID=3127345 RepID=UPI003013139E
MATELNRRGALALVAGGAVASLTLSAKGAFALTTDEARSLVNSLVADINKSINGGGSDSQLYASFEQIFSRYADVSIISQSALGVAARQASPGQLQAFAKAFQTYIARKYGRRFRDFRGTDIQVSDARAVKTFYEVQSTARVRGQAPIDVRWQVSDRSGRNLFFNVIIEGVNMLATERTEIGALLDQRRGNLDQLIKDLPSLA